MGDEEKARKNENTGWGEGQEGCLKPAFFRLTCYEYWGTNRGNRKGISPEITVLVARDSQLFWVGEIMAFISKIFKYLKYRTVRAKSFLLKGNGGFVY